MRRFQARHGISIDGIVRAETFKRLNIPCDVRLAQLKTNVGRLKALTGNLGDRYVMVQYSGGAGRGGRERRRGRPPHRRGRPARPAVAGRQQQDHRDQFQSVLDRAGVARAARSHADDAEGPELSHQRAHPHLRHARPGAAADADQLAYQRGGELPLPPGSRAISIRSAPCASIFRARTASTCTTRRRRACSARTCASIRRAACACRMCASWSTGCCATRRAGRAQQIDATDQVGRSASTPSSTQPVPVYWVYITAWATPDGVVQFRDDIYNNDGLGLYAATVKG